LPASTREWIRPADTFLFPANVALGDHGSSLARLFNTQLAIIDRSSFAQTAGNSYNQAVRCAPTTSSKNDGHARRYFRSSTVTAIESNEGLREDLRPVRDILQGERQNRGLWSAWWWANSEDKARAIITRWREKPNDGQEISQLPTLPSDLGGAS